MFVFATAKDASRAMDVIAGEVYRTCWFNLFDTMTSSTISDVSSEAWDAPPIAPHGDRQIIIGQKARSIVSTGSSSDEHLVNAYVQVGRAITVINPRYVATGDHPLFDVDQAITAATDALGHVFRP